MSTLMHNPMEWDAPGERRVSVPAVVTVAVLHIGLLWLILQSAPVLRQAEQVVVQFIAPITRLREATTAITTVREPKAKPPPVVTPPRAAITEAPPLAQPPVPAPVPTPVQPKTAIDPPLVLPPKPLPTPVPVPIAVPEPVAEAPAPRPEPVLRQRKEAPPLPEPKLDTVAAPVPSQVAIPPPPVPVPEPVVPTPPPAAVPAPPPAAPAPVPAPAPAAVPKPSPLPTVPVAPVNAPPRPSAITVTDTPAVSHGIAAPPGVAPAAAGGTGMSGGVLFNPSMLRNLPRQRSASEMANEQLNGGGRKDKFSDAVNAAERPDCVNSGQAAGILAPAVVAYNMARDKCK